MSAGAARQKSGRCERRGRRCLDRLSRVAQAVGIVEIPPLHRGTGGLQSLCRRLRAGQANHLVTGPEQLGHDRRADPARRAGDKDSHETLSSGLPRCQ